MYVKKVKGKGQFELETLLKSTSDKVGKVGWFEKSQYPKYETPVAYVAAIHEFGCPSRNIPARSFMRPTIIKRQKEWEALVLSGSKAAIKGKKTVEEVLELLTDRAAGDVKDTISSITTPKLKKKTIQQRLNKYSDKKTVGALDKPLIRTGLLFRTLIGKVEKP